MPKPNSSAMTGQNQFSLSMDGASIPAISARNRSPVSSTASADPPDAAQNPAPWARCDARAGESAHGAQSWSREEEVCRDGSVRGAEGPPQADLRHAFENGDECGVGDADGTDDQTDAREYQEETGQVGADQVVQRVGVG